MMRSFLRLQLSPLFVGSAGTNDVRKAVERVIDAHRGSALTEHVGSKKRR